VVRSVADYINARKDDPTFHPVVAVEWVDLVRSFGVTTRALAARLGGTLSYDPPPPEEAARSIRPLLKQRGLAVETLDRDYGRNNAEKRITAFLPPSIADLFSSLLAIPLKEQRTVVPPGACGFRPNDRIGDYVIERELGGGGMGCCLLVHKRSRDKEPNPPKYVLKVPRVPAAVPAFREEARTLIALSQQPHEAVAAFRGFNDFAPRLPHLVMEYVVGENLGERLLRRESTTHDQARLLGENAAFALAHCHALGISHQDLKPGNVMLREKDIGRPVLVDWGLAGAGVVRSAGTPEYMAPERWDAHGDPRAAGAPADVFALACEIWEAAVAWDFPATGEPPSLLGEPVVAADFPDEPETAAVIHGMADAELRRLMVTSRLAHSQRGLRARIERTFVGAPRTIQLLGQMLSRRAEDRPSASEVAARLRDIRMSAQK
jgi:serine/threonine protein kinase